jgi:Ca-activated chloride channel family protein
VADNASLKINFNPAAVKEYRLIGFDNRKNDMEDSSSQLEGGEIGSGQSMMAIFEINPAEKGKSLQNPVLANLTLNYKIPKTGIEQNQSFSALFAPENIDLISPVYRFAASVAMFGMVLKQSAYIQNYQLEDVLQLAKSSYDSNDLLQNDFIYLIEKAIKMAHPPKQRRRKSEN